MVKENRPGMLPETKGLLYVGGLSEPFAYMYKMKKEVLTAYTLIYCILTAYLLIAYLLIAYLLIAYLLIAYLLGARAQQPDHRVHVRHAGAEVGLHAREDRQVLPQRLQHRQG